MRSKKLRIIVAMSQFENISVILQHKQTERDLVY